jgi:transposase
VELFPITTAFLISENKSIGIKNLFKLFVSFLKDADLIAETIAIDGTKAEHITAKKLISTKD